MKKEYDSEPAYSKEFLKAKIKSHGNEVTDFYYKEVISNQIRFFFQERWQLLSTRV